MESPNPLPFFNPSPSRKPEKKKSNRSPLRTQYKNQRSLWVNIFIHLIQQSSNKIIIQDFSTCTQLQHLERCTTVLQRNIGLHTVDYIDMCAIKQVVIIYYCCRTNEILCFELEHGTHNENLSTPHRSGYSRHAFSKAGVYDCFYDRSTQQTQVSDIDRTLRNRQTLRHSWRKGI